VTDVNEGSQFYLPSIDVPIAHMKYTVPFLPLLPSRAFERSGIVAERIENWVSGRARRPWIGSGARSGRVIERERSGERTKFLTQISLKGDGSLAYW